MRIANSGETGKAKENTWLHSARIPSANLLTICKFFELPDATTIDSQCHSTVYVAADSDELGSDLQLADRKSVV